MRRAILLLLAVPIVSYAGRVFAAEALPVRLMIQSTTGRSRSQAPQTLELTLTNQVETLIEGELELSIYRGKRLVQKLRTDPLVLGSDQLRFRMMLPPIAVHNEQIPVTAVARLIGTRRTYDLEEHDVVVPPQWKRWFVLAISRPEEEAVYRDRFSIESALSAERFSSLQGDLTDLLTTPAVMSPAAFPVTSAGYTSFDVVLLEGGGFTQLRDAQLTALAAWVEAGGSVVVRPTGVLKAGHLGFLNRLGAREPGVDSYLLDEKGRLDPSSPALTAPRARYYSGLGRTVVLHQPRDQEEDFTSEEWVENAMFVWKVRADQQDAIRSTGQWNFFHRQRYPNEIDRPKLFAPQEPLLEAPLRSLLIPAKVQGLPFWVVVTILAVFLLIIAPGDYFLLGALRARRFTWVLLTATSLAFTVGTVRITESIMGTTDYRRALVFADVGPDGRPLKTSRYELLFTATQKRMDSRFQNELYVGIDDRTMRPGMLRSGVNYYATSEIIDDDSAPEAGLAADLPEYVGKLPADYALRQQMRQWSPVVNRQTSLGSSFDVPKLNWEGLGKLPWESAEGRRELLETIRETEPDARVLLFHGSSLYDVALDQKAEALSKPPGTPVGETFIPVKAGTKGPDIQVTGAGTFQHVYVPATVNGGQALDPLADLIRRACVASQHGLFAIVSQVGPTGADGFEDLALVDPSDDRQWLLAVVVSRGEDHLVFRRLYRRGN